MARCHILISRLNVSLAQYYMSKAEWWKCDLSGYVENKREKRRRRKDKQPEEYMKVEGDGHQLCRPISPSNWMNLF